MTKAEDLENQDLKKITISGHLEGLEFCKNIRHSYRLCPIDTYNSLSCSADRFAVMVMFLHLTVGIHVI